MEGDTTVITGEVIVAPSGKNDHAASWEAATDVSWLTVSDATGRGRGRFQFRLSAKGLKAGDYTTKIKVVVSGIADPFEIPVSLSVQEAPLTLPRLRHTSGYGVSAWSVIVVDSLPAGLSGSGADTAVWTATSGGSNWITIERASGGADEHVVWSRSSRLLAPGVYEDTITIAVEGNQDVTGSIVDRFEVAGRMSVEDVALDYLGVARLTPAQVRFLIWFGNENTLFDIGDVLRWFDHCKVHPADCRGSSLPPPETVRTTRSIGRQER